MSLISAGSISLDNTFKGHVTIAVFVVAGIHFSNGRLLRGRYRLHRYGFALRSKVSFRFYPASDSHKVSVDKFSYHYDRTGKLGVMYEGYMFGTALDCSVVDPDPAFEVNLDLDTNPVLYFFDQKLQFWYLSLGLRKERTSYRRCLQHSKENMQHFKR
jgi:hypothetical protein